MNKNYTFEYFVACLLQGGLWGWFFSASPVVAYGGAFLGWAILTYLKARLEA